MLIVASAHASAYETSHILMQSSDAAHDPEAVLTVNLITLILLTIGGVFSVIAENGGMHMKKDPPEKKADLHRALRRRMKRAHRYLPDLPSAMTSEGSAVSRRSAASEYHRRKRMKKTEVKYYKSMETLAPHKVRKNHEARRRRDQQAQHTSQNAGQHTSQNAGQNTGQNTTENTGKNDSI